MNQPMTNEITTIGRLKPILYEVIKAATCPPSNGGNGDVAVTQNLGVNLSPAIKKEGVNIVQLQNVQCETVIPKLIEALQIVDQIHIDTLQAPANQMVIEHDEPELIDVTVRKSDNDIINDFIQFIYINRYCLDYIRDLIRSRYYDFLKENGSVQSALDIMKMSKASIALSKKRLKNDYNHPNEDQNADT